MTLPRGRVGGPSRARVPGRDSLPSGATLAAFGSFTRDRMAASMALSGASGGDLTVRVGVQQQQQKQSSRLKGLCLNVATWVKHLKHIWNI